jgi:hypothetical protein
MIAAKMITTNNAIAKRIEDSSSTVSATGPRRLRSWIPEVVGASLITQGKNQEINNKKGSLLARPPFSCPVPPLLRAVHHNYFKPAM